MRVSTLALLFVATSCGEPLPIETTANDANPVSTTGEAVEPTADTSTAPLPDELATASAPASEVCAVSGATCAVGPQHGVCLSGRCVTSGPGCTSSLDCFDGNPCTEDQCADGVCVSIGSHGTACRNHDGIKGFCAHGTCEVSIWRPCNGACESTNECIEIPCEWDVCGKPTNKPDGTKCKTAAQGDGTCADGTCILDEDEQSEPSQKCRYRYHPYRGVYRSCRAAGLKFALADEEREKAVAELARRFDEEVRYDLHVALVELPDGGYNIITANRRKRDEVRGLVDPSFVAFVTAGYTATTRWRSRQLHVWLDPFEEGWTLPTSGSRKAIQEGRKGSQLGFLGVVDVKRYRQWLEKAFRRLPAESDVKPFQAPPLSR